MGGHDAGGATAAAMGKVPAVRIFHPFPVCSCCCLLVDHCPRCMLQQPPEQISTRPAKEQNLKEFRYEICPDKYLIFLTRILYIKDLLSFRDGMVRTM